MVTFFTSARPMNGIPQRVAFARCTRPVGPLSLRAAGTGQGFDGRSTCAARRHRRSPRRMAALGLVRLARPAHRAISAGHAGGESRRRLSRGHRGGHIFSRAPTYRRTWRLFAITGFLGALTTFSTFSAEVTELLSRGDFVAGGALAATHLAGSLLLDGRRLCNFSRARHLTQRAVHLEDSKMPHAIRMQAPGGRRRHGAGRSRARSARRGRGARPPHRDRPQLHRHLSSQRALPAADAERPRAGGGRRRRSGRAGRELGAQGDRVAYSGGAVGA